MFLKTFAVFVSSDCYYVSYIEKTAETKAYNILQSPAGVCYPTTTLYSGMLILEILMEIRKANHLTDFG